MIIAEVEAAEVAEEVTEVAINAAAMITQAEVAMITKVGVVMTIKVEAATSVVVEVAMIKEDMTMAAIKVAIINAVAAEVAIGVDTNSNINNNNHTKTKTYELKFLNSNDLVKQIKII